MAHRKNASIVNMINRTNMMLDADMDHLMSAEEQRGYRKGVAAQLECVLHENGVYVGFAYTDKAGMVRYPDGHPKAGYCESVADDTRRCYTVSRFL